MHSELYQTSKMELLWKCLIWYYEYTLESVYASDIQGSEYAWVSMLFDNARICLNRAEVEPKITVQDN